MRIQQLLEDKFYIITIFGRNYDNKMLTMKGKISNKVLYSEIEQKNFSFDTK